MGEKRPYKARNPGGGRKKRKPEYDTGKKLKEKLDAAVVLYNSEMSLQAIADALSLNPIKVRKLLITAEVYESDTAMGRVRLVVDKAKFSILHLC